MFNLEKSIKQDEGIRLKIYKDTNGIMTIGYGHNLTNGITLEQADEILKIDIQTAKEDIANELTWILKIVPVEKYEAIVELTFWIGINGVKKFRNMLAALKNEHWEIAAKQLMDSQLGRNFTDRAQKLADVIRG